MNTLRNFKAGTVSKPKLTIPERLIAGGRLGWGGDVTDESKRQAKISAGYNIVADILLLVAYVATSPITAIASLGVGLISVTLAESSLKAYKIAKIDGLLAKQDVDKLLAMLAEDKKIEDKLKTYDKNLKVGDLPEDLKKACYKAILRRYKVMRVLKVAIQEANAG